jgi:histone arginine demethylase JMJD6
MISPSCLNDTTTTKKKKEKTWERRLKNAKRKHRPKLTDWAQCGFSNMSRRYKNFQCIQQEDAQIKSQSIEIDTLDRLFEVTNLSYRKNPTHPPIHRIDSSILSVTDFIERYEKPRIPCIIKNIPSNESWEAHHKWTFSYLRSSFKDVLFKVGEDDEGYKVKVKMKYFLQYLRYNDDDSPLYVFDSSYDVNKVAKQLLQEYKVPSYFPDDLFSLVGEDRRPPYRWFLVGPERSGTCLHIDPLGTSAWNTLLVGTKRWVLFPPGLKKSVVKGTDLILKGEDDEATNYFIDILPRIKKEYAGQVPIIEFFQRPGDTVYVPGGWWHAVLNVQDTIAVTQNYCSRANFEEVWVKTRSGRRKMSTKWLKLLHIHYPELARKAEELNQRDDFVMYVKSSKSKSDSKSDSMTKKNYNKRPFSSDHNSNGKEEEEVADKRKKI